MKKIVFATLLTAVHVGLWGYEPMSVKKVLSDNHVEARGSYLYFLDEDLRDTYSGIGQYGGELTIQVYDMLYGWAEIDYYMGTGCAGCSSQFTRLTMVPCSLGAKFIYNRHRFQPYVGIGAVFTYVKIFTDSDYFIRDLANWTAGGLFKFGLLYQPTNYFVIDLFMDYAIQNVQMDGSQYVNVIIDRLNLSSLSIGGGIGYHF